MPDLRSYDYVIVRIVPRPERGEFVNVGVILFSREANYLDGRIEPAWERIRMLSPDVDREEIERQLTYIKRVIAGDPEGGPIAALSPSQRFHWLAGTRSTVVQVSPMHAGLCNEPAESLERVFGEMVRTPGHQ